MNLPVIDFPTCRHRGTEEVSPGRYPCNNPALMAPKGVSAANCQECATLKNYCNVPIGKIERGVKVKKVKVEKEIIRIAPEEIPCIHRLEILRQEGCGCGNRDQKIDVYRCSIEGDCTVYSPGKALKQSNGKRVPSCMACQHPKDRIPERNEMTTTETEAVEKIPYVSDIALDAENLELTVAKAEMSVPKRLSKPGPLTAEQRLAILQARQTQNQRKPIQFSLRYDDNIKLPVELLYSHLDRLPAGHPQRLPAFLMQGLKTAVEVMQRDIAVSVSADGKVSVGNVAEAGNSESSTTTEN